MNKPLLFRCEYVFDYCSAALPKWGNKFIKEAWLGVPNNCICKYMVMLIIPCKHCFDVTFRMLKYRKNNAECLWSRIIYSNVAYSYVSISLGFT